RLRVVGVRYRQAFAKRWHVPSRCRDVFVVDVPLRTQPFPLVPLLPVTVSTGKGSPSIPESTLPRRRFSLPRILESDAPASHASHTQLRKEQEPRRPTLRRGSFEAERVTPPGEGLQPNE